MNSFDAAVRLADLVQAIEQLAERGRRNAPGAIETELTSIVGMAREATGLAHRLCTLGEGVAHELPGD